MICCFEGSALQGPFSHSFFIRSQYFLWIMHTEMHFTLVVSEKISYFYPENSKLYKLCGTKVAHCIAIQNCTYGKSKDVRKDFHNQNHKV